MISGVDEQSAVRAQTQKNEDSENKDPQGATCMGQGGQGQVTLDHVLTDRVSLQPINEATEHQRVDRVPGPQIEGEAEGEGVN